MFCIRWGPAVLFGAWVSLLPIAVSGQPLTGQLRGQVVDWNRDPVAGATVVLTGPALLPGQLEAVADHEGRFRFARLGPGTYAVRGALAGFGTVRLEGVQVTLGAVAEVRLELRAEVDEQVVVSAPPPSLDRVSTRTSTSYPRVVMEQLPARSVATLLNYTPGVTGDSTRGSTVRANAWQADAVDISDPTVGTRLVSFNYDAIEEVQIQTGGHPAEVGQVTGALVNVVTKSGGNELSGQGNFYYQDDTFSMRNGRSITDRFPGLTSARLLRRIDTQGQLGGPVARNRVWFFGAVRYLDADDEVVGFSDADGRPIPTNRREDFGFGKITAQLSTRHKVVLGVTRNALTLDNRGAGALVPPVSTRDQRGVDWVPTAEWLGTLGTTSVAHVRYTVVDDFFDLVPKNDQPACLNLDTGVLGCSGGFADLNERLRRQLAGSISRLFDRGGLHDVKVGVQVEASESRRDVNVNQGLYRYTLSDGLGGETPYLVETYRDPATAAAVDRVSLFAQDSWTLSTGLTLNLGLRLDRTTGGFPLQEGSGGGTVPARSGIVTTTDVSPRLGLAYALGGTGRQVIRASYSRYVDTLLTQHFSGVNPNAISGAERAACAGPLGHLCVAGDGEFSSAVLREFGPGNSELDPGLGLGKADEYVLGFESAVGARSTLSVTYVDKREFDLIEDVERRTFTPRLAHEPGDTEVDELGAVVSTAVGQTLTIFDPDLASPSSLLITNPDLARRRYRGLELAGERRFTERWWLRGSFVVSRSEGLVGTSFAETTSISALFDSPNSLINAEGRLALDRRYQLKLLGTWQAFWGITISPYYRWLSGRPYQRTVQLTEYDADGDGVNDTLLDGGAVLVNAETRGRRSLNDLHLVDVRLEKAFSAPGGRIGLVVDTFNLFNRATVTSRHLRTAGGTRFGDPLSFVPPRQMRVAARYYW
ncbi:MAG: hypothetical protein CL441_06275 [Acidimicrobiaceae bacterium]|nr:hypothetical protein [Acidimicrobiaceae bacterium]